MNLTGLTELVLRQFYPDEVPPGCQLIPTAPSSTSGLTVLCRCGWRATWDVPFFEGLLGSKQALMNAILSSISGHLRQRWNEINPTLADLTDWGWFCPEASA